MEPQEDGTVVWLQGAEGTLVSVDAAAARRASAFLAGVLDESPELAVPAGVGVGVGAEPPPFVPLPEVADDDLPAVARALERFAARPWTLRVCALVGDLAAARWRAPEEGRVRVAARLLAEVLDEDISPSVSPADAVSAASAIASGKNSEEEDPLDRLISERGGRAAGSSDPDPGARAETPALPGPEPRLPAYRHAGVFDPLDPFGSRNATVPTPRDFCGMDRANFFLPALTPKAPSASACRAAARFVRAARLGAALGGFLGVRGADVALPLAAAASARLSVRPGSAPGDEIAAALDAVVSADVLDALFFLDPELVSAFGRAKFDMKSPFVDPEDRSIVVARALGDAAARARRLGGAAHLVVPAGNGGAAGQQAEAVGPADFFGAAKWAASVNFCVSDYGLYSGGPPSRDPIWGWSDVSANDPGSRFMGLDFLTRAQVAAVECGLAAQLTAAARAIAGLRGEGPRPVLRAIGCRLFARLAVAEQNGASFTSALASGLRVEVFDRAPRCADELGVQCLEALGEVAPPRLADPWTRVDRTGWKNALAPAIVAWLDTVPPDADLTVYLLPGRAGVWRLLPPCLLDPASVRRASVDTVVAGELDHFLLRDHDDTPPASPGAGTSAADADADSEGDAPRWDGVTFRPVFRVDELVLGVGAGDMLAAIPPVPRQYLDARDRCGLRVEPVIQVGDAMPPTIIEFAELAAAGRGGDADFAGHVAPPASPPPASPPLPQPAPGTVLFGAGAPQRAPPAPAPRAGAPAPPPAPAQGAPAPQ